jgi:hypothetical protein
LNVESFRGACHNGHVSVVQWFYDQGGIDIHAQDDYAFRTTCIHGHLSIAQWLYTFGGISTFVLKRSLHSTIDGRVRSWLQSIIAES